MSFMEQRTIFVRLAEVRLNRTDVHLFFAAANGSDELAAAGDGDGRLPLLQSLLPAAVARRARGPALGRVGHSTRLLQKR